MGLDFRCEARPQGELPRHGSETVCTQPGLSLVSKVPEKGLACCRTASCSQADVPSPSGADSGSGFQYPEATATPALGT